jgi:hypothetical protein
LVVTLLQITIGVQAPSSYAASGSIGSSTASGSCATTVGETSYVTVTFVNNAFCLLKFTTSTSWTIPNGVNAIDLLIVGGGGGGGGDGGGGGGGGEVRITSGVAAPTGATINVTVGNGGAGSSHTPGIAGTYGGTSSLVISGTTYSAGGGANAVGWQEAASYALAGSGGSGGSAITGSTNYSRGGRNSVQANLGVGTVGYDGVSTSFTGTSLTFAGGGGGGICSENLTQGSFGGLAGGLGGGGRGAQYIYNYGSDAGQPGTNGLGGGGGGGSACGSMATNGSTTRTPGGRGGDGVVYIKYVPVVYLAANPQSSSGAVGSTVTFTSTPYATISGATRTKKWQVLVPGGSWSDIAGATGSDSYTTPTLSRSMHGNQYRYIVTDTVSTAYSSTASNGATLSVTAPSQGDTDTALTKFPSSYGYAYLLSAGAESVKALTNDAYTFEAWVRPANVCTGAYCTIAGREGDWLLSYNSGELTFITWTSANTWGSWQSTGTNIPLNQWSHVALTKNSTTWSLYVNGTKTYSATLSYVPLASSGYYFYVGERWGGGYSFNGSIDEVRLWRSDRASSIATDMNSTATTGTNLLAYWNFNEGSGSTAYNQVPGAIVGSDFTIDDSISWDADVISTQVQSGPYTLRTFKRSFLTLNGGWKVPTGVSRVSTLLVAGGGGGGGGLNGGGGGAGGFIETTTTVSAGSWYPVTVGAGGLGALTGNDALNAPSNGGNSTAFSLTAIGGGKGSAEFYSPYAHYAASSGGSGGGGSWGNNSTNYTGRAGTAGQGNKGGDNLSNCCFGAGGGGAGAVGGNTTSTTAGAGGAGKVSVITGTTLAGGGGGSLRGSSGNTIGTGGAGGSGGGGAAASSGNAKPNTTNGPQSGAANTGGGGGAGVIQGGATDGPGAQGGTGIVVVRWITASVPTYTKPTNAYLNAGMTETFTTNVSQDSATAVLIRTFKWESSTTGASGTFSLIKQGTGSSNASFSWVPIDTSTSGSNFVYRLTVTDSDTMGLSITDSSTAYAVINRPLNVSGVSTIPKAINLAKSETFTITLGTPTYRASLTPIIAGITLDTSTAGFAVIKIADTASVGIWLETLTVTDSVSASVTLPLSITIAAPPNLLNTAELVSNGLVLNLDAGNSSSIISDSGTVTTALTWQDLSGRKSHATTGSAVNTGGYTSTACTAPKYSSENSGALIFQTNTENCYYTSYTGADLQKSYSVEAWFKTSASLPAWASVISGAFTGGTTPIPIALGSLGGSAMYVAFYDGTVNGWRYANCGYTPVVGQWTHFSGTYDGSKMITFLNGTKLCEVAFTGGFTTTPIANGLIIGKGHHGSTASAFPGAIASVRIYIRAISESEMLQNYNATKARFDNSNVSQLTPVKKYGLLKAESFTTTSGYGSSSVTYSVGDRAGIDWDTATVVNQINLSLQESLTVGIYNDTITVTDSLGQSTYLPITFTVTKADTITVTMGASATAVYSGAVPTNAPKATISGLVGVDSATVGTTYSIPCALGGTCKIGDIGPGGGRVFYISNTPINSADGVSSGGIYLEAAPRNWNGDATGEAGTPFAIVTTSVSGTSSAIGTGAENTRRWASNLTFRAMAANLAMNSTFNGVSDWFVPSYDELTTMITVLAPLGLGSFSSYANLWSSTQTSNDSTKADNAWSSNPPVLNTILKTSSYYLRPIRAFSPLYSDTTTPIDVDTYTAMGTNLTFLTGAASNYQAVVYETSTLKIIQANQDRLVLNLYGAVAGQPFTLQISGGSGTGAVTETLTAGSTATNCRLSNRVLSNDNGTSDQKSCNVLITKAASRNYKVETMTATIYFMVYQGQPTDQVGGGATIGLNGQTSLSIADTNTVQAPIISSFSNSGTLDLGAGQTLSIFGSGFTGQVIVKFWRNKSTTSLTPTSTGEIRVLPQQIPSGALSGPVTVILSNGATAVSATSLTIVGIYLAPTI